MKNLIAELLVKLAEKEETAKELVAQVEALEIVVTALLVRMAPGEKQALTTSIDEALVLVNPAEQVSPLDQALLQQHLEKLLERARH